MGCERIDDLQLLRIEQANVADNDGSAFYFRTDVDEVDVHTINLGHELRQRIGFASTFRQS